MSPEEWLASQQTGEATPVVQVGEMTVVPTQGTAAPVQPMSPEEWLKSQTPELGFFDGIGEQITGTQRATPTTQLLPDWVAMPELNTLSMASFKSGLGTILTNPEETVQVIKSNFPDVQVSQDEKGNFVLQSSIDGQQYVIKPGFQLSDIPRTTAGIAAFTPAGRAVTIPGAIAAGAGTQALIEGTQIATGGEFSPMEVATAGAMGGAVPLASRALQAAQPAAQRMVQRFTGTTPEAPPMGAFEAQLPIAPFTEAIPPVTTVPPVSPDEINRQVGDLIKRASGKGIGATTARNELADLAQINLEARDAATRLKIELPADVFSDNAQVRAAAGLTRSAAGSEAEAAWRNTVSQAVDQADNVIKQFDTVFVEGTVAPAVVSERIKDALVKTRLALNAQADALYEEVNKAISKTFKVNLDNLNLTLNKISQEVGEAGMSSAERSLLKMLNDGDVTYGRLLREKTLIGKALKKQESPYGSMAEADLKRLYAALSEDQLANVEKLGGEELRKKLRSANLIYAKERALGKRIVSAFGNDIEGSIANKMRTAINSAAKGDSADFVRLLKIVPDDLKKETIATALASVTRSARGAEKGGFGFSEFASVYPKIRANPTVYKAIVETLGKDSADVLRDLYEISKRITDARANVLMTGKANQALLEGLQAESLVGKMLESTLAKGVATGAAAMGGPIAAGAASVLTNALTQGNKDALKAAGALFADKTFQKLAIEAAEQGTISASSAKRVTMSQSFKKYADAIMLPKSLDYRLKWLQSALQTERQLNQEQ
jgi:hypothetical protein